MLVVIDMQNDFIDGSLGTKEAQAIVPNVIREILSDQYDKILVTKDRHERNYLETNEGRHLPVEHCIFETDGYEINDGVRTALSMAKDKTYFTKPTFGCLELVPFLKEHYKEEPFEMTIIGLCTDICVVSNALILKAGFPEHPMRVLKDCCAGVTPETHSAALEVMKMNQIEVE